MGAKTQEGDDKDQKPKLEQLGLNLVLAVHLTDFWCLLTKSTTLEILWALKQKKRDYKDQKPNLRFFKG